VPKEEHINNIVMIVALAEESMEVRSIMTSADGCKRW